MSSSLLTQTWHSLLFRSTDGLEVCNNIHNHNNTVTNAYQGVQLCGPRKEFQCICDRAMTNKLSTSKRTKSYMGCRKGLAPSFAPHVPHSGTQSVTLHALVEKPKAVAVVETVNLKGST